MSERKLSAVPGAIYALLGAALVLQLCTGLWRPAPSAAAQDLHAPPPITAVRLASFGDPAPAAKLAMLYVQAFDLRADDPIPYRDLDYRTLIAWLGRILELDPAGQYPLHAASRIYAQVPDPAKTRLMLDFVFREFARDPNRRWPWLAQATVVAQHQLKDLKLAQTYAAAVQHSATGPGVPLWARQMQAFILEDMNELEQARIMIGGYIASGEVKDPGELQWLKQRLYDLEQRLER